MVLTNDNEETRKLVEQCYKLSKTVINPIIDWTDADVWEFIREYNVRYCCLYDQGYKRLGCIGCPMGKQAEDFEKYPKYKRAYIRAFQRMLDGFDIDRTTSWKSGEDVFNWWTRSDKFAGRDKLEQIEIEEGSNDETVNI